MNQLKNQIQSRRKIPQILADRYREARLLLRLIPRRVKIVVYIAIAARLVCYSSVLVQWLFPVWSGKIVDPFICPSYSNPMPSKWVIAYFCNDIESILLAYNFGRICVELSSYLFLVSIIFLTYHLIDGLMFWWNFKQYSALYVDMLWTALIFIWSVFKGYSPETIGKIRNLF